ncbi:RimK/LysX family protein [Aquimarina sp. TRL1]|uniref:ATP-dependent zinc protease family protein n=1 Tax=Aquimarina sp. (strain TRL1) TaxID=2736252 RepID=UPI0020CB59FB|nr:RimK/LysX family protein [Aquimarina sp. TRL1]
MENKKIIIGRTDKADFPLLELYGIDIKIDTGAYTSSIHCLHIKEKKKELQCCFLDQSYPEYNGKQFVFKNYDITAVKSSNGEIEERYVVKTKICLFKKVNPITLTLSSRRDMRFPVLLGRKFLSGKYIVDTALEDQSYNFCTNEY